MAARGAALRRPAHRRPRRGPLAPVDAFSRGLARGLRHQREGAATRTRLGDVDGWLLAVVAALCAFGLIMVYSASEALGYSWYGNSSYFFQRQAVYMVVGAALLLGAAKVDYHRWRAWAPALAGVALVLLVLVLVPHIGTQRLGARRWFAVGGVSVQPSALATLIAIGYFSRWLSDRAPVVRSWRGARDFTLVLLLVLGLIVLEKDLGSAIVLGGTGLTLLALAGARKRWLAMVFISLMALGWLAIKAETYRANRLACFRDPFKDPLNCGFQTVQSLFALGSGGLHGVGLGNSVQKYQWLPEAHTDFIFAIIGEELGLLGTTAVIGAFLFLAWRGVRASLRAPDLFGALLAGGITTWIGIQAFINMAAVTNVSPTTGITLPFISSGGSSLITTMLATGVLCNISAQGRRQAQGSRRIAGMARGTPLWGRDRSRLKGDTTGAHSDRGRGHGGTSHPGPGGGHSPAASAPGC
jgi:cell division protein FtsW